MSEKQWRYMVEVQIHRGYARYDGGDPAFQCGHCQQSITLLGCVFTANDWGWDVQPRVFTPGALACPRCGQDAARAFVRSLMPISGPSYFGMHFVRGEDDEENDEDGC
ncbi:MAG TPA: hypothetical protein VLQ80_02655 [Candidatus Saccharimonadia bacterium]|nr:hypothetical protein [Candidatus Saccharimonadia bacterium]